MEYGIQMSIEYVRCVFCARRWILYSDKYDGGVFRWGELTIDPSDFPLIKVYEASAGPGRGHKIKGFGGLTTVDEFNIIDMLNSSDPIHVEQAQQILDRLKNIFRSYISSGVFDIEEFL